jgi:hypothetical protein
LPIIIGPALLAIPQCQSFMLTISTYTAKQDKEGFSAVHLAVHCNGPDADFEATVKVLNTLRWKLHIIISSTKYSLSLLCRKNERLGQFKHKHPLLLLTKEKCRTAMHLAMTMEKPERALILLRETKGMYSSACMCTAGLCDWLQCL